MQTISNLKKFTYYTIRVLAFTIKGDGALSPPLNVTTDEDSKYKSDLTPQNQSLFFDLSKFTVKSSIDKPWERGGVLIYLKHIWRGAYLRGGLIEDLRKERRV